MYVCKPFPIAFIIAVYDVPCKICLQDTSGMGRYVKNFIKNTPPFVNRYKDRSNGGIPCFSEERLLERASKVRTELYLISISARIFMSICVLNQLFYVFPCF